MAPVLVPGGVAVAVVVALAACFALIAVLGARAMGAADVAEWAADADRRAAAARERATDAERRARLARYELLHMRGALRSHPCSGDGCDFASRAAARLDDMLASTEADTDGALRRERD